MDLVVIETERLVLTGYSPGDMKTIFENLPKEEIKTMLGHRSDEEYEKEAFKQREGYSTYNRKFLMFLMMDKASKIIIGRCGLHNWNPDNHRAEVGYGIEVEQFKNQGFMTEALGAVIDYGFTKLKLNRIDAMVSVNNVPSLRLIEKYNFAKEGHLRQHYFTGEGYEDSFIFSKLNGEYVEERKGRALNMDNAD